MRDRVPLLAGAATAAVGAVNVGSVMTSDLPARARTLLSLAPADEVRLAHALALPAGLALLAAAWPLVRRRRRALHAAVGLLVVLGALNLLKGLDVEEAALSWILAGVLWRSRGAFWVDHRREGLGALLAGCAAAVVAVVGAACGAVAVASSHAVGGLGGAGVAGTALHLLTLSGGPRFTKPFQWLPDALRIGGVVTAGGIAASLLAPLRHRNEAPADCRTRAAEIVRRHGSDTLSAFKLRGDLLRLYSACGRAMVAYRVEAGTLLLAGDPVGDAAAVPGLIDDVVAYARRQGLALGAVGASEAFAETMRERGMRSMYLGDEALLDTGPMDLSGGTMKTLRKAVNRVARNGYVAELHTLAELDEATLRELTEVSDRWRDGEPERGFSMAHDALVDELLPDARVVLARDEDGRVRGFLHFMPVFGRPAVSLAFMRRERDTPNGLTDFLVVEAARLLGEAGVEEFSLNFSTCGRWLREPASWVERRLAQVLRVADRWFQVERLLRFNAKFRPRWQPRYLLFGTATQLPRVALAAMWAEGQLPRPTLPRRDAAEQPEALAA